MAEATRLGSVLVVLDISGGKIVLAWREGGRESKSNQIKLQFKRNSVT